MSVKTFTKTFDLKGDMYTMSVKDLVTELITEHGLKGDANAEHPLKTLDYNGAKVVTGRYITGRGLDRVTQPDKAEFTFMVA